MRLRDKLPCISGKLPQFLLPAGITVFSLLLYHFAYLLQHDFEHIVSIASYLTWHSLFEMTGVVVSFAVFITGYYTFGQTRDLKSIFLGCAFLAIGLIDIFHTLSYKGMPEFFVDNQFANRATTFWIIARLVQAICFLVFCILPHSAKKPVRKVYFLLPALLLSVAVLVTATYFPDVLPAMYVEGSGLTGIKIALEYVVIILLVLTLVFQLYIYRKDRNNMTILLSCALILYIFSEFAFTLYNRVYDIYNYLGHIYKFIASFVIFRVMFVESVQKPYFELSSAKEKLRKYAENLDQLVEERTGEIKKLNEKLLDDLEYARDIQKALLPSQLPCDEDICIRAGYFPADRVGGDFYHSFRIDENRTAFYIGDVSGHGVAAAMLMVFVRQQIALTENERGEGQDIPDPASVLKQLYKAFNRTNFKDEVYIVLAYGVYDHTAKLLTYASAGLNASPVLFGKGRKLSDLNSRGFPICKFMDFYDAEYENHTVSLKTGDRMLFYTDGLIEAENERGEAYSVKRLKRLLNEKSAHTACEMTDIISRDIFSFVGDKPLKDDITYIIIEVK